MPDHWGTLQAETQTKHTELVFMMSEEEGYSTKRCAKVHKITISFGKEAKINKSQTHREQANSSFFGD